MVKQSKFKLLVYVFQKMKSTCTFLCKCMFYLIFMLKTKFSVDKKLKKKQKKTWDGLTMPKNYKKQQNKTNKHNIAGYVFLIFLQ